MTIKLQDMEITPLKALDSGQLYEVTIRLDSEGKIDKSYCILQVVTPDPKVFVNISPTIDKFATVRDDSTKPPHDVDSHVEDEKYGVGKGTLFIRANAEKAEKIGEAALRDAANGLVRIKLAKDAKPDMGVDWKYYEYLGDLSAVGPEHSKYMSCDVCLVSWTGCWDNFMCPKCGQGEIPSIDDDVIFEEF